MTKVRAGLHSERERGHVVCRVMVVGGGEGDVGSAMRVSCDGGRWRGGRCGVGLKSWISEWLPVTYNPSTTDRPTPDYPATPRPTVHDLDITQYCLALPWLNGDGTPKAATVHGGVQYCVRTNERQEIGDGLLFAQRQTEQ